MTTQLLAKKRIRFIASDRVVEAGETFEVDDAKQAEQLVADGAATKPGQAHMVRAGRELIELEKGRPT